MVETKNIRKVGELLRDFGMMEASGWQQNLHHVYALDFSAERAYYHPHRMLTPQTSGKRPQRIMIMSGHAEVEVYTDRRARRWVKLIDDGDQSYYIADSLLDFRWRLLPDRRQVGRFVAFKAEGRIWNVKCPPTDSGLCNIDTMRIVAWYTPQVPVAFGPDVFGGLPGLILELDDGEHHYYLQKVILEPKAADIPPPPDPPRKAVRMSWMEWLRHRRDKANDQRQTRRR